MTDGEDTPYLYQIHDRLDAIAQVRGSGNVFSDLGRADRRGSSVKNRSRHLH